MRNQRHRILFSWIAILSILLNILMPMASQAIDLTTKKTASQTGWSEICSVTGASWIKIAADGHILEKTNVKPDDAPATLQMDHCAYCLTHAASFALPPVAAFVFPVGAENARVLSFQSQAIARQIDWLAPAVRAPPSSLY
jgi:hypothetical protein